jgi:hypothetical protein
MIVTPTRVAFDESGYTGQNLSDLEQPVFTLASACLSEDEAADILSRFSGRIQGEFKYAKLKKAKRNQPLILEFLKDERINENTCQVYPTHKAFMLVAKLVDNIHEPISREMGMDLYEGRAALATANLISTTFPVFLGMTRFLRWINAFGLCCRKQDFATFERFCSETAKVYDYLSRQHADVSLIVAPVKEACSRGLCYLEDQLSAHDHNPIIPAYHVLADVWSRRVEYPFEILADESTVLSAEKEVLMKFSDPELKAVHVQHYGMSRVFPLKICAITTVASHEHSSVQLADLLAGAVCHALHAKGLQKRPEPFEEEALETIFEKKLFAGGMWPSTDVTPEALDAKGEYGTNPVDYSMRILGDDPAVRL